MQDGRRTTDVGFEDVVDPDGACRVAAGATGLQYRPAATDGRHRLWLVFPVTFCYARQWLHNPGGSPHEP